MENARISFICKDEAISTVVAPYIPRIEESVKIKGATYQVYDVIYEYEHCIAMTRDYAHVKVMLARR